MRNVLVDFSQFEREVIAEQVRDNMLVNAKAGNWNGGPVPFGFTVEDKRLIPDPQKGSVISRIFELAGQGVGANNIRDELYMMGVKSPSGGKYWHKNTIRNLLRNPIYIGKMKYAGEWHNAGHEAIIDPDLFFRVHELLDERGRLAPRTAGSRHLLSGLLHCPKCGSHLAIRYNGTKRRYMCPSRNDGVRKCDCKIVDADSVERAIEQFLIEKISDPGIISEVLKGATEKLSVNDSDLIEQKKTIEKRLSILSRSMRELFRDYYEEKLISRNQFVNINNEYLTEEKDKKKRLDEIEQILNSQEAASDQVNKMVTYAQSLKDTWDYFLPEEKSLAVREFIKEIAVNDHGLGINIFYSTFKLEATEVNNTTLTF